MILASQNSAGEMGRSTSDQSDLNRTHFLVYDVYSMGELVEIAAPKLGAEREQKFVEDFAKARQVKSSINFRTFFVALQDEVGAAHHVSLR